MNRSPREALSTAPVAPPLAEPALTEPIDPAGTSSTASGTKMSPRYVWLLVLAHFGVYLAFLTPVAISLSIRLADVAPGHEQYLGYITGAGALGVVLWSPFLGVFSDRNRSRFGRRRPFLVAGMLVGLIALLVMALAPNPVLLGLGWVLAQLGWGQVMANLTMSMADRLPEEQRGRVAGLTGFTTQVAPVVGVVLSGLFSGHMLALFLVPGIFGVAVVLLFVVLVPEDDSRGMTFAEPLTMHSLLGKFLFSPRAHRDFSWNFLGRALFYFGLTLNTTFSAFFFASRLGVSVTEVAGTLAAISVGGIVLTITGAIGGGYLSDKFRRRRSFVLASGIIFGSGAVLMGLSNSFSLLVIGSLLTSLGLGLFSSVDTALSLDVLPNRETDAGRFIGVGQFSISIPQAIAPLVAPLFLAVGSGPGEKNYTLLYIVAAAFTVAGGLVVTRVRSVR